MPGYALLSGDVECALLAARLQCTIYHYCVRLSSSDPLFPVLLPLLRPVSFPQRADAAARETSAREALAAVQGELATARETAAERRGALEAAAEARRAEAERAAEELKWSAVGTSRIMSTFTQLLFMLCSLAVQRRGGGSGRKRR